VVEDIFMKRAKFDLLVEEALARIPSPFREAMENVKVVVEDWPDPGLMLEMTGNPDEVVYGLFIGTPLTVIMTTSPGCLP
jgi:predicted Zn-dependent protease with MMP-like domain